ncbi:MAG: DsbA family protein [Bacteroidota bacterium]|nr:DsbA family protein [Bacteroidota bacterium]
MVQIIYCYDAYCGWCYGFSKVMAKIEDEYKDRFTFEVLSGGMILYEEPQHFSVLAKYIQTAHKRVEELTGTKFGQDFLWHVFHPEETDWYPSSEMPAIALCIMKEYHPDKAVAIAADLQHALNFEGRDLADKEAYRHLLLKYNIAEEEFYTRLKSEEYKEKAYYEFALVKQLHVTGYPTVLLQTSETKFYLLAQGFTDYETLKKRVESFFENSKP